MSEGRRRSASAKAFDPWAVFDHEVEMYFLTRSALRTASKPDSKLDKVVGIALMESALLHTRILADILLQRGQSAEDIRLEHLLPEWRSSRDLVAALAAFKAVWGTRGQAHSPCWTLSKTLAHPTRHRPGAFDHRKFFDRVDPAISAVVKLIAALGKRPQLEAYLAE